MVVLKTDLAASVGRSELDVAPDAAHETFCGTAALEKRAKSGETGADNSHAGLDCSPNENVVGVILFSGLTLDLWMVILRVGQFTGEIFTSRSMSGVEIIYPKGARNANAVPTRLAYSLRIACR